MEKTFFTHVSRAVACLLCLLVPFSVYSQKNNLRIETQPIKNPNELAYITKKLYGPDPTIKNDTDLVAVDETINNATIVGLGEATHGTHEFFQMKHRLLKYLVEKKGFTIFAMEAPMPQAHWINDYVLYGKGDPKALIKDMGFWVWDTKEVLEMIEWMHHYNLTAEKKIHFAGFDMQGPPSLFAQTIADNLRKIGHSFEANQIKIIAASLRPLSEKYIKFYEKLYEEITLEENIDLKYLKLLEDLKEKHLSENEFNQEEEELDSKETAEIDQIESQYNAIFKAIQDEAKKLAQQQIKELDQFTQKSIIKNKASFVNLLGADDYEWTLQNASLMNQFISINGFLLTRDQCMANNILWLQKQIPNSQLVLWAHSGHIMLGNELTRMGQYLKNSIGDKYRAIGFLTYQGQYRARSEYNAKAPVKEFDLQLPPDSSLESAINTLGMSTAFINLWNKNDLPSFLREPILTRVLIGASMLPKEAQFSGPLENVALHYDGMIYVKTTTGSQPISP